MDQSLIQLYTVGENETVTVLRDGNGSLYPVAKDCLEAMRDPIILDMAPAQAVGIGINPIRDLLESNQKNQVAVIVLALENQILTPAILRSDPDFVRLTLASLEKESVSQQVLVSERVDRNRNILHAAVTACFPTSNKPSNDSLDHEMVSSSQMHHQDAMDLLGRSSLSLRDIMRRSVKSHSDHNRDSNRASSFASPERNSDNESAGVDLMSVDASNSGAANNVWSSTSGYGASAAAAASETVSADNNPFYDPTEQKSQALSVLWVLTESAALKPFLKELMSAKDALGCTPFMLAVKGRAYSAALHLFSVAQKISVQKDPNDSDHQKKILMQMIYPRGSQPDDSPLHVLCCNDTCSFTWTGAEHINQDIFECKTCGLTGSLCCCTECARVCHKGHDCKLKRTSPTAYCDCWEKCKCKALIQGSQTSRNHLLKKLLAETDLVTYPNGRGENILLFLVQTVGRQINEQKQYKPAGRRSSLARKTPDIVVNSLSNNDNNNDMMPDHDLDPPRFARKALDKILSDWSAVKSMILTGHRDKDGDMTQQPSEGPSSATSSQSRVNRSNSFSAAEDQAFLKNQSGTALLDKFTHALIVKAGPEMLDTLLATMVRESSSSYNMKDAKIVSRRFVRSIARIGVTLCIELTPSSYSNLNATSSSSGWKKAGPSSGQLQKCRKVFQSLLPIAVEELCEMADSLISPVRMGVSRPTAPFTLVSSLQEAFTGTEEMFSVEPLLNDHNSSEESAASQRSHRQHHSSSDVEMSEARLDSDVPSATFRGASVAVDPIIDSGDVDADNEANDELEDQNADDADHISDMMGNDEAGVESLGEVPAEVESDSDDDSNPDDAGSYISNVDNVSAQRSATTGATAGSDAGAVSMTYFSEDESGDSSNGEEEDESEAAETEPDTEELSFIDDTIDRRTSGAAGASSSGAGVSSASAAIVTGSTSTSAGVRNNLAQHLQWALRHRELTSTVGSSGLVHIDPTNVRRATTTVLPSVSSEAVSMATSAVTLSRAFSIVIRQLAGLLPSLVSITENQGARSCWLSSSQLTVTPSEASQLLHFVEKRMRPTWDWLVYIMDATEGQLKFGSSLTNSSGGTIPSGMFSGSQTLVSGQSASGRSRHEASRVSDSRATHSHHPHHASHHHTSSSSGRRSGHSRFSSSSHHSHMMDSNAARKDFLSYMMSLMRGHNNEHYDSLPVLDVASLKHVAYVFDSFIYYIRSGSDSDEFNIQNRSSSSDNLSAGYRAVGDDGWPTGDNSSDNDGDDGDDDIHVYSSESPHHTGRVPEDAALMSASSVVVPADEEDSASLNVNFGASASVGGGSGGNSSSNQTNSTKGRNHGFFRRSDSTLFLGCPAPDPFSSPINESLPLAEQPHILQPSSRREELFGIPRALSSFNGSPLDSDSSDSDSGPSRISLGRRADYSAVDTNATESMDTSFQPLMTSFKSNQFSSTAETASTSGSPVTTPTSGGPPGFGSSSEPSGRKPIIVKATSSANKSSVIVHAGSIKGASGSSQNMASFGSKTDLKASKGNEETAVVQQKKLLIGNRVQHDALLGRWRLSLEIFGRVFVDDVGQEPGSVMNELGGFPVKEAKFRREMEKIRGGHQKDIIFKVDRERNGLIQETFKTLNATHNQCQRRPQLSPAPLAGARVKVTFKDEPGEGTGVARSFYTSFAEAILANEKLPPLDHCQVGQRQYLIQRLKCKEKEQTSNRNDPMPRRPFHTRSPSSSGVSRLELLTTRSSQSASDSGQHQLRHDAPPFHMPSDSGSSEYNLNNNLFTPHRQQLGVRLYPKVSQIRPGLTSQMISRITGMLLELSPALLLTLFESEESLRVKIDDAVHTIMAHDRDLSSADMMFESLGDVFNLSQRSKLTPTGNSKSDHHLLMSGLDEDEEEDNQPLFYQPGKRGYYSLRQGKCTNERLNAFRNVGRIIGLCLLQNELCPIYMNRHVIKYILKRNISWHDLAFFDPILYESLRRMVLSAEAWNGEAAIAELELRFSVDLSSEEGGSHVELLPNGRNLDVTSSNIYDYVRKYAHYRMVKSQDRALQVNLVSILFSIY